MAREPLMLSDTAMVLLREYVEIHDRLNEINFYTCLTEQEKITKSELRREMSFLEQEFMYDIWHLWVFPDIPIMRYLEWHVVFNERLTSISWRLFLPPARVRRHYADPIRPDTWSLGPFIEELEALYRQTAAQHAQTKTTP